MIPMMRRLAVVAAACATIASAPTATVDAPGAYALRLTLTPAPGGRVQRVALPARILAASRTADLRDVRVFDATGRAMPMARAGASSVALRRDTLTAMPILGSPDALRVTGVSLSLDNEGRAHVAQVDGTPAAATTGAVVLGVLLDAQRLRGDAVGLVLDAQVPVAQPVTFTVEASDDLKTWRKLGDKVIYRAPGAGTSDTVALDATDLRDTYLRVAWQADSRLLSPVSVRTTTVLTRPADTETATEIDATPPPLVDAHTIEFAVPFATPITSIRVTPAGDDALIPIRVLGRDDAEQPWVVIGAGTASRRAASDGARGRTIALNGSTARALRIEADARSAGFTAPPAIRFGFAPSALVFDATGRPPFSLTAGRVDAPDAYLSLADLVEQPADALPLATLASLDQGPVALVPIDTASATRRQTLLWAILLAATALLGAMAWVLMRRAAAADEPGGEQVKRND